MMKMKKRSEEVFKLKTKRIVALVCAIVLALSLMPTIYAEPPQTRVTSFPSSYPESALEPMSDAEISVRVEALIKTMTLTEKFSLLTQGSTRTQSPGQAYGTGFVNGVPRLGVPVLRMWDGPKGVISNSNLETSSPSSELSLAASFSQDLAYDYGKLTGSDNKATAGNVQLGIQLDHVRSPFFSRGRDSLGEDPYLTGILSTSLSQGIEDQNVMSTLKHMAAYSTMFHHPILAGMIPMPDQDDMIIDEQTLHESYLSPYERIVKAKASSAVMTSFNKINGIAAANSSYIQNDVLRDMWGFTGVTMTDWGATYDVRSAILKNGGDLEMGTSTYHTASALQALLDTGELTMDDIDTGVRHVLTAYGQIGYLGLVEVLSDGTAAIDPNPPANIELPELTGSDREALLTENDEIALESAVKGAVLLKNSDATLPIGENEKIAVIGLTGMYTLTGHYAEASFGWLQSMTSPYENLSDILGSANVDGFVGQGINGYPIDDNVLFLDALATDPGVELVIDGGMSEKIDNVELTTGTINGKTNRTYKNSADGNALENGQTATLTTWLKPDVTGEYELSMQGFGGKFKATITVDGETKVIPYSSTSSTGFQDAGSGWPTAGLVCTAEGMNTSTTTLKVDLQAGLSYEIVVDAEATSTSKDLQLRLVGFKPGEREATRAAAVAAAADNTYDKVVLFVHDLGNGTKPDKAILAMQRATLALASDQLSLLNDVVDAAKNAGNKVVVVTNVALPISMDWLDDVDAVLNMWLPGQQGGLATAELLVGQENPSGKLPVTFPAGDNDTQFGAIENSWDQLTANTVSEGIFSGYRWYDKENIKPLFAFGHGLSYTTFDYSNLKVVPLTGEEDLFEVSFKVRNAGDKTGSEVAQIYLGEADVPDGIQMAKKQLVGFARVENLAPGETSTVTVKIDRVSLSYWDPDAELVTRADGTKDKWVLTTGEREVLVAAASDDIRLRASTVPIDPVLHTVTASANTGGSITPASTEVEDGTNVDLTIAANDNYKLAAVLVDGVSIDLSLIKNGILTLEEISASTVVRALFIKADVEFAAKFIDVPKKTGNVDTWYYAAVDMLTGLDMINGTSNTTYEPERNVKRAEFTKLMFELAKTLGVEVTQGGSIPFTDMPKTNYWAEGYIGWAYTNGLVKGYDATRFGPEDSITRQDMAVLLQRFFEDYLKYELPGNTTINFNDKSEIAGYAEDAVTYVVRTGLMQGYDNNFTPKDNTLRSQVAQVLYNYLIYA